MNLYNALEIFSALAGLFVAVLLLVFPRFGSTSWMLMLILVPAVLASAILGGGPILHEPLQEYVLLSFAFLVLCGASGCLASYTLQREDYRAELKKNWVFFLTISAAAPTLVAGLYLFHPNIPVVSDPAEVIALGPAGYGAAVYLLLVSVIGLANIEQTLRGAEEHIRWEIKFLLLGIGSILVALIYVASQVLLYAPEYSFLRIQAVHIFPIIFLCSCGLILQSWRRSTGRHRVVVSQGVVYGTITLFSVGLYLVASSLIARWASQFTGPTVNTGSIIFLLSAIVLSAVLLGTAFRHRVKRWIRRNFFAGNYDYRQLWMDTTEKVRSIDSPSVTAAALAQLIHNALGSLDISIWLRISDGQVMRMVAVRGTIADSLPRELSLTEALSDITEPAAVAEFDQPALQKWPPDFLTRTKASLVVPLISSGRLVGLLTVGPDRSGKSFDRESRGFLRVLAVHAASEFHKSELLESLVQTREAEAFQTFSTFLLHDLKNFASTLSLIAKNAVRHHGNPEFQLDAFQSIFDTAEKMKRLCNGLRTFSTTAAANKALDDVNHIVQEVVDEFDPSLAKRVRLDLTSIPPMEIDRQEIARVLQNLILNANEASSDGPIEVSTRSDTRGVVICVFDKGKGIPKDFLEKELFQPFHTTKGDGLGIGLFQSKKIIESHNGTIEVESQEGEGTVVQIVLPISRGKERSIKETVLDLDAGRPTPHPYSKEMTI